MNVGYQQHGKLNLVAFSLSFYTFVHKCVFPSNVVNVMGVFQDVLEVWNFSVWHLEHFLSEVCYVLGYAGADEKKENAGLNELMRSV